MGISHFTIQGWAFYNCLWWWLEALRSIRRAVKTGGAPGNTHCSRSGIHISSSYEIIPTLNYLGFLKGIKNSLWLNSWLFQVLLMILADQPHHIFVFRLNSNFCGFIDDPEAPKFHIINSFVNHDQEWKSWWKMVGWDEPCPYPRSAQVAISGSFVDEQNDHLEADFFDKETSLKQDRSVWQCFFR